MLGVLPHRRGRRRFPSPFTRDGGKRSARRAHMSDLWHLTILTGHMRMSPRSEVADHVVSGSSPREAAPSEIPAGRATNRRSHRRAIARRADRGVEVARCFLAITPASEQSLPSIQPVRWYGAAREPIPPDARAWRFRALRRLGTIGLRDRVETQGASVVEGKPPGRSERSPSP